MNTRFARLVLHIGAVVLLSVAPRGGGRAEETQRPLTTLAIQETRGIARTNVAVSSGLPFAKGRFKKVPSISARDRAGTPLPCQFDALSRWQDGSLKWGLVSVVVPHIPANQSFTCELVETPPSKRPAAVAIERQERGFRVSYPQVVVTTNEAGLPESVARPTGAGPPSLVSGHTRLLLQGQIVDPTQIQLGDLRVEEQGPVRTVLRTQGQLALDDKTSFDFLSRITVYANGQISTSYTVFNQQVKPLHGFGVQVALAPGFQTAQLSEPAIPLNAVEDLGIRQTSAESAVWLVPGQPDKTRATRHGGGLRLSGERHILELAIRNFWQRYPSELTTNATRSQLWFYPADQQQAAALYRPGRAARGDFTIRIGTKGNLVSTASPIDHNDLHAFAGATWYRDSGVLGNYAVNDCVLPGGSYDGYVGEHMSYLQRRKFLVNEFGFWDFGDGRGSSEDTFRRNNEFGISYAMLLHYLRTGDHRFFANGVAFAQHFRDVDTLHLGDMKGKSIRHTDNHVAGGSGYDTAHQWVEGMLLEYLLTGDRRSLEVAREMGVPLIAFAHDMHKRLSAKPATIPTTERNLGWTLLSLMCLEEVTGAAEYTAAIEVLVAGVLASQDLERGHWPRELPHPDFPTGGSPFMLGVLTEALMRYHEKTGDAAVARSLIKSSYWLSEEMWNPEVKNIRYKQWDRFWNSYNDGRTIPMILPGMIYAEQLGRRDERYRQIIDDTLRVYARSCGNLAEHGEGRNFKSMGMMSRSMPRFFYYYNRARKASR